MSRRETATLPTGTVTFLFTDIEGSTRLLKRLQKVYGALLADQRRILREAARAHGGHEVDQQGDSFLFAFRRADEAVAAAIDGQRALARHRWPDGATVRVRMGIHTAEPTPSDEGYYGLGVHRAARVMAAAHGGQILVSLATSSVLQDAELPEARMRDVGEHRLKDFDRPERLYQLDVRGLKTAFPPPRTSSESPESAPAAEPAALARDVTDDLLERAELLSGLADSLAAVTAGSRGSLVLVAGEAGVGKTALLRRFCDEHRATTRILWGACDALFTPRPLGPLLDIAETTGGELRAVIEDGGKPHAVAAALLRELEPGPATILVVDDLHWADEATLDVLMIVGRRVEDVPALILASYRDDELDRAGPLQMALGALSGGRSASRLEVLPLSRDAVARLATRQGVDADELYAKTTGNSFFVTEALAAGEDEISPTVRDAVLARAARLSPPARTLLEAVAIAPPEVELWLLDALAGDSVEHLDECLTSGMLTPRTAAVAFRHELARIAVEGSLPPNRHLALHRNALAALAAPPTGMPDLERLADHAEAASDGDAVLEFAPAAAERAASLGAHREAAAQYGRALRFAGDLTLEARAELLKRRSRECYLTDQADEAIAALTAAIDCYRKLGDRRREGDSLRALANILWCPGRVDEAGQAAREALAVLEALPPGKELAMTYATIAQLRKDADDVESAEAWGRQAIELAERLEDAATLAHALNTVGTAELLAGTPDGQAKLARSLDLARREGLEDHVGRAFIHYVQVGTRRRSYELADRYLETGLAYHREHGIDLWQFYLFAFRARMELDRGRWNEAVDSAALVLQKRCISTFPRILAFVVQGLVRGRRGDSEAWPPLDEARELAEPPGELPRIAPVAAARAEVAWLEGRPEAVRDETDAAYELASRRRAPWPAGELAYWRWRADIQEEAPPGIPEPYAAQIAGDWARAAALWKELRSPYEAALALADSDDEDALRRAVEELEALGARPATALVASRLAARAG